MYFTGASFPTYLCYNIFILIKTICSTLMSHCVCVHITVVY